MREEQGNRFEPSLNQETTLLLNLSVMRRNPKNVFEKTNHIFREQKKHGWVGVFPTPDYKAVKS